MPRTKGSKNRITASTDFDAQIAKLQKDKAMLEEGLSKTVAQIEELKTDIKSLRESLISAVDILIRITMAIDPYLMDVTKKWQASQIIKFKNREFEDILDFRIAN